MDATNAIFYIAILIMSVVIHEVSHGFMAERFGDPTARNSGRLTLNPLKHLDPVGSVLLPALLYFSTVATGHPVVFGWARPVPYNPNNLSNRKWGTVAVAAAGVLANLLIALVFGLLIRFSLNLNLPVGFYTITASIVMTNLALAIFNLVPIPPLDGSKILFSLLPKSFFSLLMFLERYGFIFLLAFVFFFSGSIVPAMVFLFTLITGIPLR